MRGDLTARPAPDLLVPGVELRVLFYRGHGWRAGSASGSVNGDRGRWNSPQFHL